MFLYPSLSAVTRAAPFWASVTATMTLLGRVLAALVFALLFQQTESQEPFRWSCLLLEILMTPNFLSARYAVQFGQIVFADVVSGKQDDRSCLLIVQQPLEAVSSGLR